MVFWCLWWRRRSRRKKNNGVGGENKKKKRRESRNQNGRNLFALDAGMLLCGVVVFVLVVCGVSSGDSVVIT